MNKELYLFSGTNRFSLSLKGMFGWSVFYVSLYFCLCYTYIFSIRVRLIFRYKEELTAQQKQDIKLLIREKSHPKISSEILRELTQSKCRGENGIRS
jgi:hypothetical protein